MLIIKMLTGVVVGESFGYFNIEEDETTRERPINLANVPISNLRLVDNVIVLYNPEKTLAELKAEKTSEIKTACRLAIVSGIDNDALGADHHYPTTTEDQINISGLFTRSVALGAGGEPYKFWCSDSGGVWARRSHTTAQIQAVGQSVAAHVIAMQDIYETKLADIAAAVDATEVNAIVW